MKAHASLISLQGAWFKVQLYIPIFYILLWENMMLIKGATLFDNPGDWLFIPYASTSKATAEQADFVSSHQSLLGIDIHLYGPHLSDVTASKGSAEY